MPVNYLPYFEYEHDEDGEVDVGIACPECGDPADYCLDHKHWNCDECGECYDIDQNPEVAVWVCACDVDVDDCGTDSLTPCPVAECVSERVDAN